MTLPFQGLWPYVIEYGLGEDLGDVLAQRADCAQARGDCAQMGMSKSEALSRLMNLGAGQAANADVDRKPDALDR